MRGRSATLTEHELKVLFRIVKKLRDKGITIIYISHRLASTRFCDRILFLADGRIREQGSHEELMKQNGAYAHMFDVQSHYYNEEGDPACAAE